MVSFARAQWVLLEVLSLQLGTENDYMRNSLNNL